jgi:hypothetical protein
MAGLFDTAEKLSRAPLGIIALFIVLVYGIAGLVAGASEIGPIDRTIIVLFLAVFPFAVLATFGWLVFNSPGHLYSPDAYTAEQLPQMYGRSRIDDPIRHSQPKQSVPRPGSVKTEMVGSLYWLSHDLMWTADILLRQAPKSEVLIGFGQAMHHMNEVGLGGSQVVVRTAVLQDLISRSAELSPADRDRYAGELGSIIDQIGVAAEEAQQPSFKPPPHWNRIRGQAPGPTESMGEGRGDYS